MLPGSVDPRRPDKQQRYKPPPANNNAAPGEDLTPDYMNILDPQRKSMQTTCRSDRFKVVKIESTEPFKRGRWECMDFLDQSFNRIFQRNCNNNRHVSSDTHLRPVSPNFQIDLQTSMLQIFHRQNNSIFDPNNTKNTVVAQFHQTILQTCNKKYQNHVLRPGMVSSSLVGIKYPFEKNFEKDEPSPSNESWKTRPATVSDCHVRRDNQKFPNMSSDYSNLPVYQNLNQDLLNNGQYIENTLPQPQNYPEIYQEQIITYVDNCLPQPRITTNTTEVYTTLAPNLTSELNNNQNYVNFQSNIQLNQQLTQITENINDPPQILYHPNPRFQDEGQYSPVQTESQIRNNIIFDQLSSVISTNSYEHIPSTAEDESLQALKPVLQEVFDSYPEHQQILNPGQSNPLVMPVYSAREESSCVRSFLRDEKNIVACSSPSQGPQSIDVKIEQLMDLVKKHLKFAVLEDVNVMKQQILILKRRVAQLEYENALLRSCEDKYKRQDDV